MVIVTELGLLIENSLKNQSLTLRGLSEIVNIDKGTLSRIKNGKRKATPSHLEALSVGLSIPLHQLYTAAGYPIELEEVKYSNGIHSTIVDIQNMLTLTGMENRPFSVEQVENQLAELNQYSQTPEGKNKILQNFKKKIDKVGSVGPFINELSALFSRFAKGKASTAELAVIGGVLMYFIIPVDVLPDYLFPVGYLDDAISVRIASKTLLDKSLG